MKIDAHTKLYCIFGNPVRHSLSPKIHNTAFEYYNINSIYLAFEPNSIKNAVESMKTLPIYGASITIPFKEEVIKYCDEVDPMAQKIGSVNTLVFENSKIKGYNTDGPGFLESLGYNKVTYKDKNILIIGNGGSARAISFNLAEQVKKLTIAGRNPDKIKYLVDDLKKYYHNIDHTLIKDLTDEFTKDYNIIINTTPVGMEPNSQFSPVESNIIHQHHILCDIVYKPLITKFLEYGLQKQCKIITGNYMLLFQACKQFELWTGKKAPLEILKSILTEN